MKIGVLKYFAKLTEKHLRHSLSFKKLATLGTPTHVFLFFTEHLCGTAFVTQPLNLGQLANQIPTRHSFQPE